ncbi:hypothetical protein V8F44DRAFT_614336 [Aspergillus fumigatus]
MLEKRREGVAVSFVSHRIRWCLGHLSLFYLLACFPSLWLRFTSTRSWIFGVQTLAWIGLSSLKVIVAYIVF